MAPQMVGPHLVELGLVGLEVIGHAGPDLLGLPPKQLPELGSLLALGEQRDLRFPLPLVLVDLLSEEPVVGAGETAGGLPAAPPSPLSSPTWPWWCCSAWPGARATPRG